MSTIDTSTWSDSQKADFAALEAAIAEESSKTELAEAKREAERLNPINVLAERKAELEAQKKAAAVAMAELEADAVFRKASATYGKNRVARIVTQEGSIILRPLTGAEVDEFSVRLEALTDAADKLKTAYEMSELGVLYPAQPVFAAMVTKWPKLRVSVHEASEALLDGIRQEAAKKG